MTQATGEQFKEPKVIRAGPTDKNSPDVEPLPSTPTESPIESPVAWPMTPEPILPAKRRIQEDLGAEEYASPAFIKRARVSYGSLFEGGFNLFDEEPEASTRGRKRTKFGRDSSAWRYTSQSRSPEPEVAQEEREGPSEPSEEPRNETSQDKGAEEPGAQAGELRSEATQEKDGSKPSDQAEERHEAAQGKEEVEPSDRSDEPRQETPAEAPSSESRASVRPQMTDDGCQTVETSFLPVTPTPAARREELTITYESNSMLATATHVEERVSSPSRPQAAMDHRQPDNLGGMPQEVIPGGTSHVDAPPAQPLQAGHAPFTLFQEQALHLGEPGIGSPFGGFGGQQVPWGSSVPYPTMPPSYGLPFDSFAPHQEASPYPDLPQQPFGRPFQHPQVEEPARSARDEHASAERPQEPPPQQSEPYLVSSDIESVKSDGEDEEPTAEAEEELPMRLEDNLKSLLPEQPPKEEWVKAVEHTEPRPGPEMTSRVDEEMDVEEAESFPSDDGDEGGDYDTRNYADLQDNDDRPDIDEDQEDYGEMNEEMYDEDEDVFDQEEGYDQDGVEYDEEGEGEDEEEGQYDEWEYPTQPPPPAPSAPVFIDLISDSEDEDQGRDDSVRDRQEEGKVKEEKRDKAVDGHHETEEGLQTEDEAEDGSQEEEKYSDEEGEDGVRSHGDEEEGKGEEEKEAEDEDSHPTTQPQVQISSPSQPHETRGGIRRVSVAAEQDEAEGPGDVEMADMGPEFVAILSSPPPEEPSSPVGAKTAGQPGQPEPTEMGDEAPSPMRMEAVEQAARPEPTEAKHASSSPMRMETAEQPAQPEPKETRDEPRSPMDTKVVEQPAEPEPTETPTADEQKARATPETSEPADVSMTEEAQEDVAQPVEDKPEQEPAPVVEMDESGPSIQVTAADADVQMASPAAERPTLEPTTSLSDRAQEPNQPVEEKHGEAEVVAPEPVYESLDDQVQADIERQMEDSIVVDREDVGAAAEDAGEQPEKVTSGAQPHDEPRGDKETSPRPLRGVEALASPPLTQPTQHHEVEVTEGAVSQETITAPEHREADHLPTPDVTQPPSAAQSFKDAMDMARQEDTRKTEKVTLASPTLEPEAPETKTTPRTRQDAASPTTETAPSQKTKGAIHVATPSSAEGFAITIKSLRNRGHSRSVSAEKDLSKRDPSKRMARDSLAAREKSASKGDPNSQLGKVSLAARRAAVAVDTTPRSTGRTTRSRTRSTQMSASPEPEVKSPELGDAAEPEPERESQTLLKLQLNKILRLTLLDLTALKVLRANINRKVDVFGVATAQPPNPQRPKSGPRDHLLPLTITDQTTAPNNVVAVQVFRPHIESLPVVKEGDAVLLRQFTVTALRGRGFGLRSCETSSWAVWERDREDDLPQIKGPPMEVSREEGAQAGLLMKWYAGLDEKAMEKLGRANARIGPG